MRGMMDGGMSVNSLCSSVNNETGATTQRLF